MTTAPEDGTAITPATQARLREAQLDLVNSQLWMTAISTPILTILVSIVLWPLIAHATILIWLGLSLTVLAARMYGYVRFTQIAPTGQAIEFWDRYITGTTTLSSFMWGIAMLLLWPAGHPTHQLVLAMPLAGVAAGGTAAYAPVKKIYLLFIAGVMIPLVLRFLLEGTPEHASIGIMGVLYFGMLMGIGGNLHASGAAAFIIGFQKGELADSLAAKNDALEDALSSIKTLSGMLPICANCKKIRDDQGYYQQIEHYITEHSEAQFTHGICPDCAQELYPDIKYPDS